MHSVFDFNLHIPGNALLLAFVFGILANPVSEPPGAGVRDFRYWMAWTRLALPALGVAFALLGVPKIRGEYYTERSREALRDRKFQESISLAEKALETEKLNPDPYFYIGEARRFLANASRSEMGKFLYFDSSVDAFRDAQKLLPEEENILVGLALSLEGINEFDAADAIYRTAIRWDPNLAVLRLIYGNALKRAGRADDAEAQYAIARGIGTEPYFQRPKPPGPL